MVFQKYHFDKIQKQHFEKVQKEEQVPCTHSSQNAYICALA